MRQHARAALRLVRARVLCQMQAPYRPITSLPLPPIAGPQKLRARVLRSTAALQHAELTMRAPENNSMARAQGFNKPRVQAFFDMLGEIYDREQLSTDRLYNMDETSLSTVQGEQQSM